MSEEVSSLAIQHSATLGRAATNKISGFRNNKQLRRCKKKATKWKGERERVQAEEGKPLVEQPRS